MATDTTTAAGTAIDRPITLRDRLAGWREIMQTANPPASGRSTPSASGWS